MRRLLAILLGLVLAAGSSARVEVHEFENPEQEARYSKLIDELRCLVCQNQNLADSNAELAVDMRRKTYEMVRQDKSEKEIVDFMVQRYGEFVMYRPPLNSNTLLLWTGPFIILAVGVGLLIRTIARRRRETALGVSDATLKTAASLLENDRENKDA